MACLCPSLFLFLNDFHVSLCARRIGAIRQAFFHTSNTSYTPCHVIVTKSKVENQNQHEMQLYERKSCNIDSFVHSYMSRDSIRAR